MNDIEKLTVQIFTEEMSKKDNFLCEVIDNYNKLQEENGKLTQTCESLLNIQYALAKSCKKYTDCLEEIKAYCKSCENGLQPTKIVNYIDEILDNEVNNDN